MSRDKQKKMQATARYAARHPWVRVYHNILGRCCNPKHPAYYVYGEKGIQCFLTIEELKILWFRDKAYLMLRPSIDRQHVTDNYEFTCCRFIELGKNIAEMNKRTKSKAVNQFDLEGNFIKTWPSAREVQRALGYNQCSISKVCRGVEHTCQGYKWSFV